MATKTFTAYRELPFEVEYNYYAPSLGSRDSYGVPLEPDEPAAVEICSVTLYGIEVLNVLPKNIIRELEEQAMKEVEESIQSHEEEKVEGSIQSREEEKADYLYEQWKEGRLKE